MDQRWFCYDHWLSCKNVTLFSWKQEWLFSLFYVKVIDFMKVKFLVTHCAFTLQTDKFKSFQQAPNNESLIESETNKTMYTQSTAINRDKTFHQNSVISPCQRSALRRVWRECDRVKDGDKTQAAGRGPIVFKQYRQTWSHRVSYKSK